MEVLVFCSYLTLFLFVLAVLMLLASVEYKFNLIDIQSLWMASELRGNESTEVVWY